MTPRKHSLVHGCSLAIAAMCGLIGGSLLGSFYGGTIANESKWSGALGAGLGLVIAVLGVGFIVRRFVPVHCPRCSLRMKCHVVAHGDTSLGIYRCGHCGQSECPALARWIRGLATTLPVDDQTKGETREED